ncbi:MAG: hypothetical protein SGPRY_007491 [Prymnesium sp.]
MIGNVCTNIREPSLGIFANRRTSSCINKPARLPFTNLIASSRATMKAPLSLTDALQPTHHARLLLSAEEPFNVVHCSPGWFLLSGHRFLDIAGKPFFDFAQLHPKHLLSSASESADNPCRRHTHTVVRVIKLIDVKMGSPFIKGQLSSQQRHRLHAIVAYQPACSDELAKFNSISTDSDSQSSDTEEEPSDTEGSFSAALQHSDRSNNQAIRERSAAYAASIGEVQMKCEDG